MPGKNFKDKILYIYFLFSLIILSFFFGMASQRFHIFPYPIIHKVYSSLKRVDTVQVNNPRDNPSHFYHYLYEGEGVMVNHEPKVCPGPILLTGDWEKDGKRYHGFQLIDREGHPLHSWRVEPKEIWDQTPHRDRRSGELFGRDKTHLHGAVLLPHGEIVCSIDGLGLVKINSRSEVVWKLEERTHHSVFLDEEGYFWVCARRWNEDNLKGYVGLTPPFVEDFVFKVSQEGTVEREISVLDRLYECGYYGLLFTDIRNPSTHLNDVEVLGESMADQFEIFEAGDIMISLREVNTVFVLDGESEIIKWALTYPFLRQHDPDFTEEGYITVFDNQVDKISADSPLGGTRILKVDPLTKSVETVYGQKPDQYFFTEIGGKHQHLPNGNILISEVLSDRVFEITPSGEVVWSWLAPLRDEPRPYVDKIWEGELYGRDYTEFIEQ